MKPGRRITCFAECCERDRAEYRARRKRGECTQCGCNAKGALCTACMAIRREALREQRHTRRAAGLCIECGAPASGASRCPRCTQLRAQRPSRSPTYRAEREYEPSRAKLRAMGYCENGREHGKRVDARHCKACRKAWAQRIAERKERALAAERAKRADRIARRLCVACGKRASRKRKTCSACAARTREYFRGKYADRKARGVCVGCGGPREGSEARCADCRAAVRAGCRRRQRPPPAP